MFVKKRGARIGAATSAVVLAAVIGLAGPASAVTYSSSGTNSCGQFRAVQIVAETTAGTTSFYWGQVPGGGYTDFQQFNSTVTSTKRKSTGLNAIIWKVDAPDIKSAGGVCYYA